MFGSSWGPERGWGGGCVVPNDCFLVRMTGVRRTDRRKENEFFFFFCCFVSTTFFAQAGRGDHAHWLPDAGFPPEGASPSDFVDSVFGFLGPCGVLLPLGGLGPLAVFSRFFP